jgi:hypothetical protein
MSSATSIEKGAVPASPATESAPDAGFRPWHFFVLASLMAATAAVVMSQQSTPEHLILISLTIAAAGFAAAGFYRMLSPLTENDVMATVDPLSQRMRSTLEREKALTLRSIKELEFDRAMGKVSAKDFDEMAGRLRSRAIGLMKQLDHEDAGFRALIERDLQARLAERPAPRPKTAAAVGACSGCGTANDADAMFCKRCGQKLHES